MVRFTLFCMVFGSSYIGQCERVVTNGQSPPPRPQPEDGYAKLRDRGRPTPGPVSALSISGGTVVAVDTESVTVKGWQGLRAENAKRADYSEPERLSRWERLEPGKPIRLFGPGWEVDCDRFRYTTDGMVVTLLTGEEINAAGDLARPRRFPAAQVLRQPESGTWVGGAKHVHQLSDVRVGDKVSFELQGKLGMEACTHIRILRRPGGRVPYSSVNPGDFREMIDRDNAHQQYEERGIPIPDRYRLDVILREGVRAPGPNPHASPKRP